MPFPHAVITGGSSGIGKATARLLAAARYHVTLIARDAARLEAAAAEVGHCRVERDQVVGAFPADVADEAAINGAIAAGIAEAGPPDVVIAAAGMVHPAYVHETPTEIFTRTMAVNCLGAVHTVRAALPAMRERKRGHVVLVSSGAGLIGLPGYSAYCASKFALRGLADSLRVELRPSGIRVSIVYPPDPDTPQLREELKTRPPEAQAIAAGAKVMSADGVARAIVRGIERRSYTIAPCWEMAALARLNSLLEPALQWYADRLAARARARG
jgi:3-dehydrosphinganine reductase